MKRMIRLAGILSLGALLAACDKCGDPIKFTLFVQPAKSCSNGNPQG